MLVAVASSPGAYEEERKSLQSSFSCVHEPQEHKAKHTSTSPRPPLITGTFSPSQRHLLTLPKAPSHPPKGTSPSQRHLLTLPKAPSHPPKGTFSPSQRHLLTLQRPHPPKGTFSPSQNISTNLFVYKFKKH